MPAPSSGSQQHLWEDLPQDVLREVSRRLRDAVDYVHFHAVCKPWRSSSHDEPTRKHSSLLPWLLAPDIFPTFLKMRCVFSRTSYRAPSPFPVGRPRDWVARDDGTAVWFFHARPSPSLRDPLTGAVARLLPPFPNENGPSRWKDYSPNGIVYNDGTVLLCKVCDQNSNTDILRTALLHPGDAAWTLVERTFASSYYVDESCVAYHGGKILVVLDGPVVAPSDSAEDDVLTLSRPSSPDKKYCVSHFLLESRGELLCVSINAMSEFPDRFGGKASIPGMVRALSVSVHALEEAAPGKILWVRKDGGSLADRVFFLGWPNSFAVDASQLNGDAVIGGCAYFVYDDLDVPMPNIPCYVFRYDLVRDKAKFMEQLPQPWGAAAIEFTWLFPQPSIAPIQAITERLEGRKWWKMQKKLHTALTPWSNIDIEKQPKCYNSYLRVFVRNLPRDVDSFELRKFFSKHGKVSNAKVRCKKKKKTSKKIGLVTITMVEEEIDALAALNGLVFNGCILEVRLVGRWKGQRVPPAISNQHTRRHHIYIGLLILFFVIIMVLWISSIAATRGSVPCYIPELRPREARIEGGIPIPVGVVLHNV